MGFRRSGVRTPSGPPCQLLYQSKRNAERMDSTFNLTVNGQSRSVATDPDRPLLDVLREEFQLTGTKYGCGEGQCRACTVLLDGKSVPSCMTSVAAADGRRILTIEGLAKGGALHPVQQAFADPGAFQSGYSTAAMIIGVVVFPPNKPP